MKDPYVLLNIPKLQEQWFDRNSDLLRPIPLELPLFREINHRISLIDDERGITIICLNAPKLYKKNFRRRSPGMSQPGGGR